MSLAHASVWNNNNYMVLRSNFPKLLGVKLPANSEKP